MAKSKETEIPQPSSLLEEKHSLPIRIAALILLAIIFWNYSGISGDVSVNGQEVIKKNLPSICTGSKNVHLSSAGSYVEQKVERDCLSGLVDLPNNLRGAGSYFPGETEVYECQNSDLTTCSYLFILPELGGKVYRDPPKFPKTFRLRGKPGTAWFGEKKGAII